MLWEDTASDGAWQLALVHPLFRKGANSLGDLRAGSGGLWAQLSVTVQGAVLWAPNFQLPFGQTQDPNRLDPQMLVVLMAPSLRIGELWVPGRGMVLWVVQTLMPPPRACHGLKSLKEAGASRGYVFLAPTS